VPPEDWRSRVQDIVDSLDKVEGYLSGMSLQDFIEDARTRDVVIWNIAVIGEAARLIPVAVQESNHSVPWAKMRGMRNVLMHEYFGIDDKILWETAARDLPALRAQLAQILLDEAKK
jgi:uncharacterized protein with HEPN domain